jgi:hypothetical protein
MRHGSQVMSGISGIGKGKGVCPAEQHICELTGSAWVMRPNVCASDKGRVGPDNYIKN